MCVLRVTVKMRQYWAAIEGGAVGVALNRMTTAAAVFFFLLFATQSGWAQSASAAAAAARDPEYQALFQRMYANPRDVEATFRFAEVATRLGDYEAAIGALERILLFNPNLARVKVQLGRLYLRIGGTQVAHGYFEQALATPGAPPDVVATAQQLLLSGETVAAGSGFSLYVYSGMRYQTNANVGPNSNLIRAFGDTNAIDRQFRREPDWNYFTLANVGYVHDLGNGIAAEIGFFGYFAKQIDLPRYDLAMVEVQAGPRFALPSGFLSAASVKVYGIGTATWLAQDPYYNGAGVGVSSRFTLGELARLEPSYEYRDRNFKNSELWPISAQQTGILHIAALNADGRLMGQPWVARVSGSWNRTDELLFDFNSYDRVSGDIGFPIAFTLNLWGIPQQWVFTPTAGFSHTDYSRPNPVIDAGITRTDKEWRVGAALDVPVYDRWGIRTYVQYAETTSSLPNFDMTNFSVSFGPTFRF